MKRCSFTSRAWDVYPIQNEIASGGERVHLEPRVMDLMVLLANRAGEVVSRAAILESVWHGTCVSDDGVNVAVSQLRRALGDNPRTPAFIATVPKRGYRWIAPIEWNEEDDSLVASSLAESGTGQDVRATVIVGPRGRLPRIALGAVVLTCAVIAIGVLRFSGAPSTRDTKTDHGALGVDSDTSRSQIDAEFRSLKIRGWRLLNQRDTDSIRAARQYFQRMVYLRPDSAEAHASVSAAYTMEVDNAVGNEQRRGALEPQARRALAKAIALDSTGPTVLYARGLITLLFDRDHSRALADLRLAQRKLPTNPRFSAALAWVWAAVGETGRAADVAAITLTLDPTSIRIHLDLAMLLSFASRFDEALDVLELALELEPGSIAATMARAWVLEHAGKDGLAYSTLIVGLQKQSTPSAQLEELARAWERDGLQGVLRQRAAHATVEAESGGGSWLTVGSLRARGNDTDGAIAALRRSQRNTEGLLIYALESPDFRTIREDSRFQALISQVRVSLNARSPLPTKRKPSQRL